MGTLVWRRENPCKELTKEAFAPVLAEVVKRNKPETLINGFRKCGLYPRNPDEVDYSRCLGTNLSNNEDVGLEKL